MDDRGYAAKALERIFGFTSFRPGQEQAIDAIVHGRDVMAVMPTGGGKSVCYQLPAARPGTFTLVITPLRALMRDQVAHLEARGIPAALIDSGVDAGERDAIYRRALDGGLRLLYVAPERLATPDFDAFAHRMPISLLAVDEAHCVLHWGADFRPAYMRIGSFIDSLEPRPVVAALTATASRGQSDEIVRLLGLHDPVRVTTGADRPNITIHVIEARRRDRLKAMTRWALDHDGSGIIYLENRDGCERLAADLRAEGIDAEHFHAGMTDQDKRRVQDGFLAGSPRVMVATSAFGMGVDKPDVRWVINDGPCKSLEAYWQEAGRAGRDGRHADSILYWSPGDFVWLRRLADDERDAAERSGDPDRADAARLMRGRLDAMSRYCDARSCLRARILAMLDPDTAHPTTCGDCTNCMHGPDPACPDPARTTRRRRDAPRAIRRAPTPTAGSTRSLLRTAARYLAAAHRETGHGLGATTLAQGLRGADTKRVHANHLDRIDGYGSLKGLDRDTVTNLFAMLVDMQAAVKGDFNTINPGPLIETLTGPHDDKENG